MNICGAGGQEEMRAQNEAMRAILAAIVTLLSKPGRAPKRRILRMIPCELHPSEQDGRADGVAGKRGE